MISESFTKLVWGGFVVVNRSAGVDQAGHTNAIHDILADNFL
jgi:hypothetical protein